MSEHGGGLDFITSSLRVIKPTDEDGFTVTFREWERIREKIKTMPEPEKWAAGLGWTAFGVFGGALLALLSWHPVYEGLPRESQFLFSWLTPTFVALAIGSLVIGALAMVFDSRFHRVQKYAAAQVVEDMDFISVRHPRSPVKPAEPPVIEPGTFDPDEIPF